VTIWKYPLVVVDEQTVQMPAMATMLCVQLQQESPCLWALVDEINPKTQRRILIRGTGHDASGIVGYRYIGTFQMLEGRLVFHVFDGGDV
jgi:hypothetical protein